MRDQVIHPSNLTLIDGAIFDGPHEGQLRRRTAAEWLRRYAHDQRASIAIRRARDGQEGAAFAAIDGVVWHLRRVDFD
jgi:hypothetical protein